ncbi:hypothetical protein [Halarcobacter sp.]|uniref:hypothetical protein n=1 Tax=Halarcobacter sp. TaxID=2321133 RepID=UPI002AA78943|nr:hypothetical protein [Halarcobacter sp.]
MKEILDVIVLVLFVFMIFMFIKGFNKQQIEKHTKKLDEIEEKKNSDKDKINE